jgi:branched-chain amino acid transport system permease protein
MFELSGHALVQGLINGLTLGWIYILIALGLALILSIMNIMQFAHGEIYMVGAYIVYYFAVIAGLNFFLALLVSMLTMAAFGIFLERFLFRPLLGNFLSAMCGAIGLMLILQSSIVAGFGIADKNITNFWPGVFNIAGWILPRDRALAVIFALVLTLLSYLFLKKSRYGQAIVASAQHREGALLQGINPNQMSAMVMAIGSALAAVGGALAGSIFMLTPYMGSTALIKGIIIVVLGGMGSISGVVVGGMILGFADGLLPLAFGPAVGVIVPLLVIIVILLIKPQGLFGYE